MRSRATIFSPPWPAMPLFLAIVGTQVLAVLICGFGWFVPAIPWTIIGLVWLYMLVWMFALDVVKLALYSRIRRGHAQAHWYRRFLASRHAARSVAEAAKAGA
jgi:H+-transporting ATPase